MGIEPTCSAWKADILPLNYTRMAFQQKILYHNGDRMSIVYSKKSHIKQKKMVTELLQSQIADWQTKGVMYMCSNHKKTYLKSDNIVI